LLPYKLWKLIASPGFELYDWWEALIQVIAQRNAEAYLRSPLDQQTMRGPMFTLIDRSGPDARIALSERPRTATYLLEISVLYQLRRPP
jgi:hypothetical protein